MKDEGVVGVVDVREEEVDECPEHRPVRVVREFCGTKVEDDQKDGAKHSTGNHPCLLGIRLGGLGFVAGIYGGRRGVHYFHAGED